MHEQLVNQKMSVEFCARLGTWRAETVAFVNKAWGKQITGHVTLFSRHKSHQDDLDGEVTPRPGQDMTAIKQNWF